MLRSLLIYLSCALALAGCTAREEPRPVDDYILVVGVDPDYAPFEFYQDSLTGPVGFDIELMSWICRLNDWRADFREMPFENLLAALTGGEIEAAISAITITPQRQAVVEFSDPCYLTGQSLVVPSGDSTIGGLADLRGRKIGVQRGSVGEELAKRCDGALVFGHDNIGEAFRHLADGKLDAVIDGYPSTRVYLAVYDNIKIVSPHISSQYYGIAVRKEDHERLDAINNALAVLIGDGTYDRLHVKWFGYPWQEDSSQGF